MQIAMTRQSSRPRIGLLAITLEYYDRLAPGLRPRREQWLRGEVIPALAGGIVEELKSEYRRCYAPAEDVSEIDLEAAARAEVSLRSIAADRRLDALSFQFLVFGDPNNANAVLRTQGEATLDSSFPDGTSKTILFAERS